MFTGKHSPGIQPVFEELCLKQSRTAFSQKGLLIKRGTREGNNASSQNRTFVAIIENVVFSGVSLEEGNYILVTTAVGLLTSVKGNYIFETKEVFTNKLVPAGFIVNFHFIE